MEQADGEVGVPIGQRVVIAELGRAGELQPERFAAREVCSQRLYDLSHGEALLTEDELVQGRERVRDVRHADPLDPARVVGRSPLGEVAPALEATLYKHRGQGGGVVVHVSLLDEVEVVDHAIHMVVELGAESLYHVVHALEAAWVDGRGARPGPRVPPATAVHGELHAYRHVE